MSRVSTRQNVRIRAVVSLLVGIGGGAVVSGFLGVAAGAVAAWGVFALVNVIWIFAVIWRMDAAVTRSHATAEDPGRRAAAVISVVGSLVSLAAVGIVIVQAQQATDAGKYVLAGIAVLSAATSWTLIQVDYVLRYARMYYGDPVGGIQFNQKEEPEYSDFVYFSLGLGMTYQVADTNVTNNAFRRVVVAQTVLAYLFGTVILATIINLVTGLS